MKALEGAGLVEVERHRGRLPGIVILYFRVHLESYCQSLEQRVEISTLGTLLPGLLNLLKLDDDLVRIRQVAVVPYRLNSIRKHGVDADIIVVSCPL